MMENATFADDHNRTLPGDVLQLICEELGERQDFGTLFNCALSGKSNPLAKLAIEWMYRVHSKSSVVTGDDTELTSGRGLTMQARSDEQRKNIAMWALQWKSIIRSSLGNTFYPYSLYIRSLDLRNLEELLSEPMFREDILSNFFEDDMARFLKSLDGLQRNKLRGSRKQMYIRLDVPLILDLVGGVITSFVSHEAVQNNASVALEDLAGNINTISLQLWAGKLSKLKSLTLWDGAVLNASVATTISQHCFEFDDLTFFTCIPRGTTTLVDVDNTMASFFNGLRINSLRTFSALSAKAVGPVTLQSLNHHAKSLKVLKLDGLDSASIKALSNLKYCQALETLSIVDLEGLIDLEATENDVFLEVIAWLGNCKQLRNIHMTKVTSAPAILAQVCLNNDITLRELEGNNYNLLGNIPFHQAISHQTSLESLKLSAESEGPFRDDIDALVTSISALTKLKYLNLISTSDHFGLMQITHLVNSLKNLEELWIGGYDITDRIFPSLSTLTHLKSLNIHALSTFTTNGILNYIATLKSTNQGFQLFVMNQSLEYNLTDTDQARIRSSIAAKVDGHFDYVLFRDAESEDESFSD